MAFAIPVVAAVAGAAITSSAVKGAANKQADATRQGIEAQNAQYAQTRTDQTPWRDTGSAAIYRIADLLGLTRPGGARLGAPAPTAPTREQFTTVTPGRSYQPTAGVSVVRGPSSTSFDQAGYDQAMRDYDAALAEANGGQPADFGEFMRDYTIEDFYNDPVAQLGLDFGQREGTKALERRQRLTSGFDSGQMLKELLRYNQDYGQTKAADSYSRFNANRDSKFGKLAAVSGIGQTGAQATSAAGANAANNNTALISSLGNAQAASGIAQGNAWGGAIQNLGNWWQQQQILDRLRPATAATPVSTNSTW